MWLNIQADVAFNIEQGGIECLAFKKHLLSRSWGWGWGWWALVGFNANVM